MDLRKLLEDASPDVLELNKNVIDSLKRSTKRGISNKAPAMSDPERTLETYWRMLGGPELVREYVFSEEQEWRLDFYHEETKTAIEIHGGVWSGGRHVTGKGFTGDRKKMNRAQELGIRVFEIVTPVDFTEVERVYKHVVKELARRREKDGGDGIDGKGSATQAAVDEEGAAPALDTPGRRHGRAKKFGRARRKGAND